MLRSTTLFLVICTLAFNFEVTYGERNWDFECEFPVGTANNQYLNSITMKGEKCGQLCWDVEECTHFNYNGRACILLSGAVTMEDSEPKQDINGVGFVCGVLRPQFS